MVVHEHRFEVRLGPWSDFIFCEGAERVALVRTLEVIVWSEVEEREAGDELIPVPAERVALTSLAGDRIQRAETAERVGARSAAIEFARICRWVRSERAEGVITARLQHRVLAAVGRVGHDMAAAVRKAGAERARDVLRPTIDPGPMPRPEVEVQLRLDLVRAHAVGV